MADKGALVISLHNNIKPKIKQAADSISSTDANWLGSQQNPIKISVQEYAEMARWVPKVFEQMFGMGHHGKT